MTESNSADWTRRDFVRAAAAGGLVAAALCEDALARVQQAQQHVVGRTPESLAADEDFWFEVQQAYTVDRSIINLNNGGVSPSPRIAQDAMRRHLEFMNNAPAKNLWQIQEPQVEAVRNDLATTFGCPAEELAITRNASEALETCILGLDLKAGDEALTTEQDYPRMINTWRQREARDGIVLRQIPLSVPVQSADEVVEAFARAITPRTRVMLCCHVIFVTGQILPVREICRLGRERGIEVIVDGAHAFAHLPFQQPDLDCDYYGVSLHKWLTAPVGTGLLYVRKGKIEALWPLMAAEAKQKSDIRKFEQIGTHPAANKLAIAEALALYHAIGPQRKAARLRFLRDRWARPLLADSRVRLFTRLEPEHGCCIATFHVDGIDDTKLVEHLWGKYRIFAVHIDYANVQGIRVSPNTYTTIDEIDLFVRAVQDVLVNGLPA